METGINNIEKKTNIINLKNLSNETLQEKIRRLKKNENKILETQSRIKSYSKSNVYWYNFYILKLLKNNSNDDDDDDFDLKNQNSISNEKEIINSIEKFKNNLFLNEKIFNDITFNNENQT
jgi:hypothetical protein